MMKTLGMLKADGRSGTPWPRAFVGLFAAVILSVSAVPANAGVNADSGIYAHTSDSAIEKVDLEFEVLDPATFEGEVIVATTKGDVLVVVERGELESVAAEIRKAVERGESIEDVTAAFAQGGGIAPMSSCLSWKFATAGAGFWATSTPGCSVFGYPGYMRIYNYANTSSVGACYRGLGWNGSATQYYTAGCLGAGGSTSQSAPWGNVLMNTRTQGTSLGGSGSAYQWQY